MPKKPWPVLVGEYTSLAFLLPVCVVLGYALGYLIDQEFGTDWIKYAGLLVGIAAGMTQLIRQLMRDTKDEGPPQDE
jgi:F0F1-type ATP synthase assembly protein I